MEYQKIILSFLSFFLGIRTLLWHLQNWQIREYRFDRTKAYFKTKEGKKNFFNLWFFRGILPRPRFSGRIILIILIVIFLLVTDYLIFYQCVEICNSESILAKISREFFCLDWIWKILIYERFLWLFTFLAVKISEIPVYLKKKRIYAKALQIIKSRDKNIKIIGITGSYGKSSTRKILTHVLRKEFGANSVLTNPENQNTELAIARLILKSREFFYKKIKNKKFLVIEIGAYRRGEIKTVCDFLLPEIGILTGINNQHIALFGSQENIVRGKFELAEASSEKVFFNTDNNFLKQVFADKETRAIPVPVSRNSAKILKNDLIKTVFEFYGQKFTLPWGGDFFVENAVLAMETALFLGCKIENLAQNLSTLLPLEKALNIEKTAKGTFILRDLYSQNESGVLSAISHLAKFSLQGESKTRKLIFVGMPLLELDKDSKNVHKKIFSKLKDIQAEVFWFKDEFFDLGKDICGNNFHGNDIKLLKKIRGNLKKDEAILFSGRLPNEIWK